MVSKGIPISGIYKLFFIAISALERKFKPRFQWFEVRTLSVSAVDVEVEL